MAAATTTSETDDENEVWKIINDAILEMGPLPTTADLQGLGSNPGPSKAGSLNPGCGKVCITGASGFIAMHLVALLLEKGYDVVATVRSANKSAQVSALGINYPNKLTIIEGCDLMKSGSFDEAINGCVGVFHTASPFYRVSDKGYGASVAGWNELIIPAYQGTKTVLESCMKSDSVKRVIITASYACMINVGNPNFPPDYNYTDETWNISSFPNDKNEWSIDPGMNTYRYSKIIAEKTAWEYAQKSNFDIVCINPPLVIGDNLTKVSKPTELNESSRIIYNFLTTSPNIELPPNSMGFVDVKDVVQAHVLTYETEAAGGNRYLTTAPAMLWSDLSRLLKEICPQNNNIAQENKQDDKKMRVLDTSRLEVLGMTFTSAEEAIRSQVMSLIDQFPEVEFGGDNTSCT